MLQKAMLSKRKSKPLRVEVLERLVKILPGRNLLELAQCYSISISFGGKKNKGWVGQTIERAAGLNLDPSAARDGEDFELKTTELLFRDGQFVPKETLKITQLNPKSVLDEEFENSVFWQKFGRLILVGYYNPAPDIYLTKKILPVDVNNPAIYREVKSFWDDVRHVVCSGEICGLNNLGSSEGYVQLRPLGNGKQTSVCPVSGRRFPARAFYATKKLIQLLINEAAL
ncbi:MAG: hypothetical protein EB078_00150 [Proteobacteria bacterium]|nr:hypothetical protein [Pseudomonadota bacterium]NDC23186.1 hypothetical protein [Pseudomonadota bacterium]NDD03291.1 hypothetical protein [Pseudomonadota bacterium]NDG27468.1 hypothetical protein [Pseudomonadota bacterium]